ncbi:MAG: DNA gyrase subunit A [candidate division Zixibacteria bacterium]|nr:DNA gyrase subunit A [candidate division Zixibacteria bacterium]
MERQNIVPVLLEEEMKNSYLDYSMSVITNRALPDVRDGLKPSNRRILVAMNDLNLAPGKGFRKCAKIAGDTSGNYHPHGEQVIYPTLVRMAQDFNMRYPLIDGQGNFGSVDGDSAAAMRYTEARLTPIAMELLADMEKETVPMMDNYDGNLTEPRVLPGRFPNLICNGATGIAVGMATSMPPHNLTEIVKAIVYLIENPECDVQDLMKIITGPDFPTGGIIMGRDGIHEAYTTGRGRVQVRARVNVETDKRGREAIIVDELPYQVNKANLIERIADLVRDKHIDGISDLRDESDRDGMRMVVEIKRDAQADIVLNQLFKKTQLQSTFSIQLLTLVDGAPRTLNLFDMLKEFVDHRHIIIVKRTEFDLRKAEARAHILEGYKIALDNIDAVVDLIKKSNDTPAAREGLMRTFKLTEIQANAILDMRLARLTGLERKKIEEEYAGLIKTIEKLRAILASKDMRMKIIKDEMFELRDKYGDERRTVITGAAEDFSVEDLIAEEDMVITITHAGYVKRLSTSQYRKQRRGGKGVIGSTTREEDFTEHLFVASTHEYILFFTNKGRCYWLKVHAIPTGGKLARGKPVIQLIGIENGETVTAFTRVKSFDSEKFIVLATKNGMIKRVKLDAFSNPRKAGVNAMNLPAGDELIEAAISDGSFDIVLGSRDGQAIRFPEEKVRAMGRTAYGVRGIALAKGDYLIGMVVIKRQSSLLVVTENGYGKRSALEDYRITNRGGKGIINIKTSDRNGKVVTIQEALDTDDLIMMTRHGISNRMAVADINVIGRNTQGVRLIKLKGDDKLIDVARVVKEEEE